MRFFKVTSTFAKYLVFYKFTRFRKEILGQRLKLAFSELGLTYIKIGQILSMRYDILSKEDCGALQQLLDSVNPLPFEDIIAVIEKEYQKPYKEVFAIIDPVPLGSASVSQVHKAILFDGSVVAVKVKRPGVDDKFLADVKIMKKLAAIGSVLFPILKHIQIKELVNYFESWIKQDLDFALEARNMRLIKEQYSFGDERHFRPDLGKGMFISPFENLCTKNIIVMDYINGIPMSRKEEILSRPDYDIEKSLKTYMNAAMRNWFRDDIDVYYFQADPHLSNVLALPHGDAANIDCGLVSELTKKEANICRELIISVYMQDLNKAIKVACKMTSVSEAQYASVLKPDLESYLQKTQGEGFGFWFIEFARIMVKHRIKFPLFLTTFGRTNLVLDGLMATYIPEQTTLDIVGEELKRQAVKEMFKNFTGADWFKAAYAASEKVKQAPELIVNFIKDPLEIISKLAAAIKTTI